MKLSKHVLRAIIAVLILTAAGAGIYRRIATARDATAAASGSAPRADLPDVASAATRFDADAPVPVEGSDVLHGELVLTVNAAGEAASRRATQVRAQVGGQIRSITVRENSVTGAGQVLVEIDPAEYELTLAEAKANLRQAMATFRELTMFDEQNIKDEKLRKEREEAARDRARVPGSEIAVQRAELNLQRTRVRAPFGGRIANLKVVPGQFVGAGDELLTVQEMDPIAVDVQVLQGQIGNIAQGKPAQVTFAAFPGQVFEGVVETINPIVEQQRRSARVRVRVPNAAGRILPGMYARVTLGAERLPDRIMVPRRAVLERDNGRKLVFVFEPDSAGSETGRAKWRYVTPGNENEEYVELLPDDNEGVRPGEIVLVAGHLTLTHDKMVRLTANAARDGGRPE